MYVAAVAHCLEGSKMKFVLFWAILLALFGGD